MKEVLLASQSPRRRELLSALNINYTIVSINCDEHYPSNLTKGDIPLYIAKEKAEAYKDKLLPSQILITADTIVWLDNCMIGKPTDANDAIHILKLLSGHTHEVFTAVCMTSCEQQITKVDRTAVTFGQLTDEQINYYVRNFNPLDKAGAYGIQDWIGYVACTKIDGSYTNVMGFPTHLIQPMLNEFINK